MRSRSDERNVPNATSLPSRLRELLVGLGFEQAELADKNHRVFRHPLSGCVLLLPDNKSLEAPRPADLVGVRTHLAYRGHMDEQAFEQFIEKAAQPTE